MNYKEIGMRLKEARKWWGFTQSQVADFLGISQGQMAKLENGRRKLRDNDLINEICNLYLIDEDWLLYEEGESQLYTRSIHICYLR